MENNAPNVVMKVCMHSKTVALNAAYVSLNTAQIVLKKILNSFTTLAWKIQQIKPLKTWDGATTKSGIIIWIIVLRYLITWQNSFENCLERLNAMSPYFGGKKKGPRGRGAQEKVKVFGMLERQGRIFTAIVDNVTAEILMSEIINHAKKGSVFYPDKFKSYKSLKFYG